MKIDITDWDTKHDVDFTQVIRWLDESFGKSRVSDKSMFQMIADRWCIYATQSSIEGLYETTHWIEFDREEDGVAFLLRWS